MRMVIENLKEGGFVVGIEGDDYHVNMPRLMYSCSTLAEALAYVRKKFIDVLEKEDEGNHK